MASCIYCGCTDSRACMIPTANLDAAAAAAVLEYFETELAFVGDELPSSVACWWISQDPPVCSAPACAAQYLLTLRT